MILIVHPKLRQAKEAAEIFAYMGVLAVAAKPKEALSEISLYYRAVLVFNPSALPVAEDFVRRMKERGGGVPLFMVAENEADRKHAALFAHAFDFDDYSSRILLTIRKIQEALSLPPAGCYALAGLCLDCDKKTAYYCDRPIHFTKTEAMILRYLIRTYPNGADVHHVLRYALRPGNLCEPSVIRTHVWSINRKFLQLTGRRLVESLPGEGYRIVTPETEMALV